MNDSDDALILVREIVKAADARKASDIKVLKVSEVSYLTDFFVVVTGFSNAQIRAIARSIDEHVEETLQRQPERTEGLNDGGWVLLDYGETIVHIFLPQEREFYNLEAFWGHAETIDISNFLDVSP
ncbi:MAG: ribosome silencing factor [Merismopedia sp. SIO2A8]|nr:ribosome silencing factor [Merismopedia sp. SIO2A8]